jgi:hypothetical protein
MTAEALRLSVMLLRPDMDEETRYQAEIVRLGNVMDALRAAWIANPPKGSWIKFEVRALSPITLQPTMIELIAEAHLDDVGKPGPALTIGLPIRR